MSTGKQASAQQEIPTATHTGILEAGPGLRIRCAVLPDKTRLVTERDMKKVLGRKGNQSRNCVHELPPFLAADNLKPFISPELIASTNPIVFWMPKQPGVGGGRRLAHGYPHTVLLEVCRVYRRANRAGVTTEHQKATVEACEDLTDFWADVGLMALIDEATGYQKDRASNELQARIAFLIQDQPREWKAIFIDEFYDEICRLRRWPRKGRGSAGPRCLAWYTKRVVYDRLFKDKKKPLFNDVPTLAELETRNPIVNHKREHMHHQFLTEEIGKRTLEERLKEIILLARQFGPGCWHDFYRAVERNWPLHGDTVQRDLHDLGLPMNPADKWIDPIVANQN